LILALPDLFTLHSVVERKPPQGKTGSTVGDKFNVSPKVYNSVDDLLKDPEVELVVIGTPNTTHFPIAKAALEAGKHVIVDKPITTSYADAVELSKLAKSRNLILTAYQNRRWDSDFLTVRKLISEKVLGDLHDFVSHYDRYRPNLKVNWREEPGPGAGIIWDLGSHLIDQVVVLFGRPAKVTGFVQNLRGKGHASVGDEYTVLLHYPRGTAGSAYPLTVTVRTHPLSQRDPQLRFIVRGDKGTFVKHGLDTQEAALLKGDVSLITSAGFGVEPKEIWGELETLEGETAVKKTIESQPGTYLELYRTLAGAIRKGDPLGVKWDDAALNILLIELALQSSEQGRTIDVPQE
jgi:predicted dehydrogenase